MAALSPVLLQLLPEPGLWPVKSLHVLHSPSQPLLPSALPLRCVAFRDMSSFPQLALHLELGGSWRQLAFLLPSLDKTDQSCPRNRMSRDLKQVCGRQAKGGILMCQKRVVSESMCLAKVTITVTERPRLGQKTLFPEPPPV